MSNLEARDRGARVRSTRALLVAVQCPAQSDAEITRSLSELEQLLGGLGVVVDARVVQKRPSVDGTTFVGEGKIRELAATTGGPGALPRGPEPVAPVTRDDLVVVVDAELTPSQQRNLESALGVEVIDRTAVILRVFAARARTRTARLEVELARLLYELPRIRDDHGLGDRQGGGGRASRGHTNVELAKQRSRERIAALRRDLDALASDAETRRRARAETFRVALVGYTNAGKSSLMRLLTGSDVLVEDKLFATLDTTTRPLAPPHAPPILVTDTVGFIRDLPHALVASFRSTLEEARESWLVLHVVDASDPAHAQQQRVTEDVLRELGIDDKPTWVLLNKIDRVDADARAELVAAQPDAIPTCGLDATSGAQLRARISAFFDAHLVEARITVPWARHAAFAELRPQLRVLSEVYEDELTLTVRATPEVLGRLHHRLASR